MDERHRRCCRRHYWLRQHCGMLAPPGGIWWSPGVKAVPDAIAVPLVMAVHQKNDRAETEVYSIAESRREYTSFYPRGPLIHNTVTVVSVILVLLYCCSGSDSVTKQRSANRIKWCRSKHRPTTESAEGRNRYSQQSQRVKWTEVSEAKSVRSQEPLAQSVEPWCCSDVSDARLGNVKRVAITLLPPVALPVWWSKVRAGDMTLLLLHGEGAVD